MNDASGADEVSCETHGRRPLALVCTHLFEGEKRGFHCAEDPQNLVCPDAWCSACDRLVRQAGEWTEETVAQMDIKLVCDLCYEALRERNWLEEPGEYERLLHRAIAFLQERQERAMQDFRLGQHTRWDWDQDRSQLIFSQAGKPQVIADVVFVGSVSTRSDSWMWSWANPSILEGAKARMQEVRRYGDEHRLLKLAAARWSATEPDGHEMSAITAYLLDAAGFYRAPSDYGFTFLIMTQLRWAQ